MATTKTEEKLNIQGLSVNLKEGYLYIEHTPQSITASGVMLGKIATEEGNKQVNQGMLDCLLLFVPHFLMIIEMPGFKSFTADYIENEEAIKDENLKGFYVNGFSISAKGGVTIKGGVKTKSGRVTAMNAPLTSVDPEASNYEHAGDLQRLIDIACMKAGEYFLEGKFGVDLFNQPKEGDNDEGKDIALHAAADKGNK
jgi:hypothetical protein